VARRLVLVVVLVALSIPVISANAGTAGWSRQKCKSAGRAWLHTHPHHTVAQLQAYVKMLNTKHGCQIHA
jgi:hypothetical protein